MTGKGLKYLSDILMAINLIEDFTKEIADFKCTSKIVKHKVQLKDS
jgi:uncharacterized protein with HEPN domain